MEKIARGKDKEACLQTHASIPEDKTPYKSKALQALGRPCSIKGVSMREKVQNIHIVYRSMFPPPVQVLDHLPSVVAFA